MTDKDLTVLCAVLLYCQKGALGYNHKDALTEAQEFVTAYEEINIPYISGADETQFEAVQRLTQEAQELGLDYKVSKCCGKHGALAKKGFASPNAGCCCRIHSDINPYTGE